MHALDNQLDGDTQSKKDFDVSSALLGDIWAPGVTATPVTPQETIDTSLVPELTFTSFSETPPLESDNVRLINQLGSDSFRQREAAMQELQNLGLCALPDLLHAHDNGDLEIRRRVTNVIDRLGTTALPFMTAALDSDDPQTRAGAERSLARLSLESILDYAAVDNDPQRLEDARRALGSREGWQDDVSALITRDGKTGRFVPTNAEEYRRAIAGARLIENHPYVFHLSLDAGRFLLESGNHQDALNALDTSLNTLDRRLAKDPAHTLFAIDFQQQLRDHLESPAGQQLPQAVRAAITQRIERARVLQESRQPVHQEGDGK